MACAHCGADMAASQRVCSRCGHSGSAVTEAGAEGALTSLTAAPETPTPLPDRSSEHDESLTVPPVSHAEPDTHMRPAVIAGNQPNRGGAGRIAGSGLRERHLPDRHAVRAPLSSHPSARCWRHGRSVSGVGRRARRVVAIKVIRPEAMADRRRRDLERRFKRELLLARQSRTRTSSAFTTSARSTASSTSRWRISTGSDLATAQRAGRLPVRRALAIARQLPGWLQRTRPASFTAT